MFQAFDHHDRRAFADHQSLPISGERPAGVGRRHAHGFPALHRPKVMQASAPPVTAHVAPPERTKWNASPMAWVADAHALATAKQGPRRPQSMDTWLAGAFTIIFGMVRGWSRFALLPIKALVASSSCVVCPPMPVPIMVAVLSERPRSNEMLACAIASRAATTANCDTRSSIVLFAIVEMLPRIEILDLGNDLVGQLIRRDDGCVRQFHRRPAPNSTSKMPPYVRSRRRHPSRLRRHDAPFTIFRRRCFLIASTTLPTVSNSDLASLEL